MADQLMKIIYIYINFPFMHDKNQVNYHIVSLLGKEFSIHSAGFFFFSPKIDFYSFAGEVKKLENVYCGW